VTATLPDWMTQTGPVDFYDPEHPLVQELLAADGIVVDANGAHHGRGGRFVPKELEYAHLQPAAREDALPAGWTLDPKCPARVLLPAPMCPHGHYARWAERNCRGCTPSAAAPAGDALPCTGSKANGGACGRSTTYRFRGRPACHDHGGTRPA